MTWFRKRPAPPSLTREAALALKPVPHREIRAAAQPSGDLLLVYPLRLPPWMAQLAQRLGGRQTVGATRKLQLDELGSRTWQLMDGYRSVRDIAQTLSTQYRLPQAEMELAVSRFLRELGRRGLIGLR
jgi:hypothetical protein